MRILRPLLRDVDILWALALLLLLVTLMLLSATASIMNASTARAAPQWIHIPTAIALLGFLITAGAALCLTLVRAARTLARHRR